MAQVTAQQASSKAINTKISNIVRSQTALRNNIQDVLVLITQHACDYGDTTGMARLCNKLSRSVTQVSIITRFMAAHTSIRVGSDPKVKGQVKAYLKRGEDSKPIAVTRDMVEAVKANNYWEHEVPPVETIFTIEDCDTRIKNVVSFMDRLLSGEAKNGKLVDSDRQAVQALRDDVQKFLDRKPGDAMKTNAPTTNPAATKLAAAA